MGWGGLPHPGRGQKGWGERFRKQRGVGCRLVGQARRYPLGWPTQAAVATTSLEVGIFPKPAFWRCKSQSHGLTNNFLTIQLCDKALLNACKNGAKVNQIRVVIFRSHSCQHS